MTSGRSLAERFALGRVLHGLFDRVGQPFQLLLRHRPFAAGHLQTPHQFGAVKRFASLVALDDLKRGQLDLFVAGEAALALGALAAAADDVRLTAFARVDHTVFYSPAERAAHRPPYITGALRAFGVVGSQFAFQTSNDER